MWAQPHANEYSVSKVSLCLCYLIHFQYNLLLSKLECLNWLFLRYLKHVILAMLCCAWSCSALCDPVDHSLPGSSVNGKSLGKSAGVGCHTFVPGPLPTQGLSPGPLHCRRILYHLSRRGSPWVLEWVAYALSRGSSWSRDQARVSRTAGHSLPTELPGKPKLAVGLSDRFFLV